MKHQYVKRSPGREDYRDYIACVNELLENESVRSMANYDQHNGTSVLEHCLYVSYLSYRICKRMGYDYRSAARGALLHDFFLYHRLVNKPYKGWHATKHPRVALENANEMFSLNEIEQDIIVKHMWPVTMRLPKYTESLVITMVDKYCALKEFLRLIRNNRAQRIMFLCNS